MKIDKALLVFRKDWREIRRNWQVILPILIVPIMLSLLLPTLIMVIPHLSPIKDTSQGDFTVLIENFPSHVKEDLRGMSYHQIFVYVMSLYFFAPFFLIIPLMASSVIAADSFAGEKERKTIEVLLATPLSDGELFFGKILVSFIPSMVITITSFIVYSIVVNINSTIVLGRSLLPNPSWIMLIFGVAPTLALAGIGLAVLVSVRVRGFREAQQISGLLLIPILMLIFGQVSGAIIFGLGIISLLIVCLIIIDFFVFYFGTKLFRREEILSKLS